MCMGKDCRSQGMGKQQEGCHVFSHFPAFLGDAGLWGRLAVYPVSPKAKDWFEDRY